VEESPRAGTPSVMSQLDHYAERLRVQVPAAPPSLLDGYVKYVPWVSIVFGCFAAITLLALFGLASAAQAVASYYGYRYGASYAEELLFGLLLTALDIVGGYLMLQRKLTGWWLVAGALVVYLLRDLVSASLLGLILVLAVAYVHIQVKPRYT
jgi:hypothetical protein